MQSDKSPLSRSTSSSHRRKLDETPPSGTHLHILDELREEGRILGSLLHAGHSCLDVVLGVLLFVLPPLVLSGADTRGEEKNTGGGNGLEELHDLFVFGIRDREGDETVVDLFVQVAQKVMRLLRCCGAKKLTGLQFPGFSQAKS